MKNSSKTSHRILLSGGGTGGHIFPAIAIADELKQQLPQAAFLFVGALGKMEMEKVPKAGYDIKGLPIVGLDRGNKLANIGFPIKLVKSLWGARKIVKEFNPDIAIGTGGYASGPTLWAAAQKGIPVLVQEQNSFAGITNKWLAKKAQAICVAYEGMDRFFPKDRIHITGNPIRNKLFENPVPKQEAIQFFGLNPEKPIILSIGGSQGSRKINYAWHDHLQALINEDVQLIWQTGTLDHDDLIKNELSQHPNVFLTPFIYEMNNAYAAADVVVSRAGAIAISELAALAKAALLVPLPTAAEDHQTKNAEYLVARRAGLMVSDKDANAQLAKQAIELVKNKTQIKDLEENIKQIARPKATQDIVTEVMKLI